jgi:anti-sigma factor RsiW
MNDSVAEIRCAVQDVAAYLDGELDPDALIRFEAHLKSCADCAAQLRAQKQLLCTLNVAFKDSDLFALPQNFTQVVTKRAESDLSGMRRKPERRRALKLCAVLALVSFALMGAAARVIIFDPVRSFLRAVGSVLDLCWSAASEAFQSVGVIVRILGRAVFLSQRGLILFLVFVLVLSISFLLVLIARYHRAQIIE